jgi:thiamine-phosphate pyrophosphorylase
VVRAGADCLAIVSGICSAESPAHAAERFREEIAKGLNQKK